MSVGIVFDVILITLIILVFIGLNAYWSHHPLYARVPVAAVGALMLGPLLIILLLLSPLLLMVLNS